MEATIAKAAELLLDKGLLGVAVLLLGWVVYLQYKENKSLTERLLSEREQRVASALAAAASIQASSQELKSNNELLRSMTSALAQKRT